MKNFKLTFITALLISSSVNATTDVSKTDLDAAIAAGNVAIIAGNPCIIDTSTKTCSTTLAIPANMEIIKIDDNQSVSYIKQARVAADDPYVAGMREVTTTAYNSLDQNQKWTIENHGTSDFFRPPTVASGSYTPAMLAQFLLSLNDSQLRQASSYGLSGVCRILDTSKLSTGGANFSCKKMLVRVPSPTDSAVVAPGTFPPEERAQCLPNAPVTGGTMGCPQGARADLCRSSQADVEYLRREIATTLILAANARYDRCKLTDVANKIGQAIVASQLHNLIGKTLFLKQGNSNNLRCAIELEGTQVPRVKNDRKFSYNGKSYTSYFNQKICRVLYGRIINDPDSANRVPQFFSATTPSLIISAISSQHNQALLANQSDQLISKDANFDDVTDVLINDSSSLSAAIKVDPSDKGIAVDKVTTVEASYITSVNTISTTKPVLKVTSENEIQSAYDAARQ